MFRVASGDLLTESELFFDCASVKSPRCDTVESPRCKNGSIDRGQSPRSKCQVASMMDLLTEDVLSLILSTLPLRDAIPFCAVNSYMRSLDFELRSPAPLCSSSSSSNSCCPYNGTLFSAPQQRPSFQPLKHWTMLARAVVILPKVQHSGPAAAAVNKVKAAVTARPVDSADPEVYEQALIAAFSLGWTSWRLDSKLSSSPSAGWFLNALPLCRDLVGLDLEGVGLVGVAGASLLAAALTGSSGVGGRLLSRLQVGGNDLSDDGVAVLAQALPAGLRVLGLADTGITPSGWSSLGQALVKRCQGLEELEVGGNAIGEIGASSLALAVGGLPALKRFCAPLANLVETGAKQLSAALAQRTTLTYVDLSSNGLSDNGISAFITGLGPLVTTLLLSSNCLTDATAELMAGKINQLTRVDLEFNSISDTGCSTLLKALSEKTSRALGDLLLTGNLVCPDMMARLNQALARKACVQFD